MILNPSQEMYNSKISYLSTIRAVFRSVFSGLTTLNQISLTFYLSDIALSLYFWFCGLTPCTVDLDDKTTMHFWTASHRQFNKPDLIMVHGFGGTSRWQFYPHLPTLSQHFNLYIPDLLFFGKSYTTRSDRTIEFQAESVMDGLKKLGVDRFSAFGISYGGYVAYSMAEKYPDRVEKVVLVSTGVGCSNDEKIKELSKLGKSVVDVLVPDNPQDMKTLVKFSTFKHNPLKWIPNFLLQPFINSIYNHHREDKIKLMEHLMETGSGSGSILPVLTQETLLIWGDKDQVFPMYMGYQLQRHLGSKARLEIIKDTGHAANMESPDAINSLIKAFVN